LAHNGDGGDDEEAACVKQVGRYNKVGQSEVGHCRFQFFLNLFNVFVATKNSYPDGDVANAPVKKPQWSVPAMRN
jgi:hypothetical protein